MQQIMRSNQLFNRLMASQVLANEDKRAIQRAKEHIKRMRSSLRRLHAPLDNNLWRNFLPLPPKNYISVLLMAVAANERSHANEYRWLSILFPVIVELTKVQGRLVICLQLLFLEFKNVAVHRTRTFGWKFLGTLLYIFPIFPFMSARRSENC